MEVTGTGWRRTRRGRRRRASATMRIVRDPACVARGPMAVTRGVRECVYVRHEVMAGRLGYVFFTFLKFSFS